MKNILFVDDETRVLDGLKRMLRGRRREWNMSFAESGKEALTLLESSHFDVVVSDMRMPGMDGAELLARVRENYPDTVRIVLSGHCATDAAMRTVPVAHQFLNKPCESEKIREVITRTCNLREHMANRELSGLLSGLESLPATPRLYEELTRAMADPEVSFDEVAGILEQDPGISAKILQLVNSSFFGVAREISSVREAATLIGLDLIKTITLSAEVFRKFESMAIPRFDPNREQRVASLAARIAKTIAPDKATKRASFLGAMLRDVGTLVFASEFTERFGELYRRSVAENVPIQSLEEQAFGVGHPEVGAFLLALWGLPHSIVEAVAYHHAPGEVDPPSFDVYGIVHVADAFARERPDSIDTEYLARVGAAGRIEEWRTIAEREAEAAA